MGHGDGTGDGECVDCCVSTGAEQGSRWKRSGAGCGVGKGQDTVGLGTGVGWFAGSELGSLVGAGFSRSVGTGLGKKSIFSSALAKALKTAAATA